MELAMKHGRTVLFTALIFALATFGANPASAANADPFPRATPESQGLSSASLEKLLDEVKGYVKKGDIVGGELMVIKNRRTVLHEAVGLSNLAGKTPLKPGTIYCIRSMTKPMIGAAVQILIDEGRLSLDDTAAKYLPSFDNDKSRGITVRQLLTHTSGLPLSSLLGKDPAELKSLRDVADISGNNGPTIPPGSGFQYSDDGADTLGAIVSAISGQPAEAFIQKRVLEPLGMRDTFPLVSAAGSKLDRFTPAYIGSRDNWIRYWSPSEKPLFPYFLASQGMYSTTTDYARFLAMYLDEGRANKKRVLSSDAVKRTLAPANASWGSSAWYGQLMETYVDPGKKLVMFGHGGSDGTWGNAWPEHDLMVLYFTQSRGNNTGPDIHAAVYRLLLGRGGPEPETKDVTADVAAPFLGLYWFEPAQKPMIVVREKDRLALELPWQSLRELEKTGEPNVWAYQGAPDNLVSFERDGAGPATALHLRQKQQSASLVRFEPEKGLPTVDELFQRRPDRQRAEKLASLGIIRASGTADLTASKQKGSFEMLMAGEDRSRLTFSMPGLETMQLAVGDRAWARYAPSMPLQEQSKSAAQAARLNGWLLASGAWPGAYDRVRVLKRVERDGRSVILVHAAPAEGRQRLIYVDPESGLTVGYDEVQEVPGMGMIGCEVRLSDYRDVEGVQIPFESSVTYATPMLGTFIYRVEKLEIRQKVEGDPFKPL